MTFSAPAADRAAAVEQLRTRAFPERRARAGAVVSGPAYHWAELAVTPVWDGDIADREAEKAEQEDQCDALVETLTGLWGAAPQTFSLMSLSLREAQGEELPEPWSLLGRSLPELNLWQVEGRWIGIGVAGLSDDHERVLVAVVTEIDPP
ncbi:hypothetical protein [Streptomyces sp. 8L]|uniref:hypothetical protein n=1 Tax=Streptomyces sp. 8L TaxID=2877242 RepID=UPI001CD68BA5|nr:hypothetical protein [Streptomyces sp. 8L]MCA1216868.1 hypothetical protein [Streptomyces sp. 8L]